MQVYARRLDGSKASHLSFRMAAVCNSEKVCTCDFDYFAVSFVIHPCCSEEAKTIKYACADAMLSTVVLNCLLGEDNFLEWRMYVLFVSTGVSASSCVRERRRELRYR